MVERFALSARSNGKPMQSRYWRNARQKGYWTSVPFGQTFALLTGPRGAAKCVESWLESLVSHSALPGSVAARTTTAGSGLTRSKSSTMSSPTGSSSRTSEVYVPPKTPTQAKAGNLWRKSSGTWSQGDITSRLTYFPRRTSGLRTSENDSSSLPWPTTTTINRNSRNAIVLEGDAHQNHGKALGLEQVAELHLGILPKEMLDPKEIPAKWKSLWQTPAVHQGKMRRQFGKTERDEALLPAEATTTTKNVLWPTAKAGRPDQATHFKRGNKTLAAAEEEMKRWATPTASPNANRNTKPAPSHGMTHGRTTSGDAAAAVKSWVTPTTQDQMGRRYTYSRGNKDTPSVALPGQVEMWATTTRDWKDGASPSPEAPTNHLLGRQAPRSIGRLALRTGILGKLFYGNDGGSFPPCRLNPHFTAFLMGFPPGWTMLCGTTTSSNSEPTEMPSSQLRLPSPTSSSSFAQWQQSMREVVHESLAEFYA